MYALCIHAYTYCIHVHVFMIHLTRIDKEYAACILWCIHDRICIYMSMTTHQHTHMRCNAYNMHTCTCRYDASRMHRDTLCGPNLLWSECTCNTDGVWCVMSLVYIYMFMCNYTCVCVYFYVCISILYCGLNVHVIRMGCDVSWCWYVYMFMCNYTRVCV